MRLKHFLVPGFILILFSSLSAQPITGTIKGRILDSQTLEPLPFANVYINFTTIGTSANEKGEYVLKGIPIGDHDLVVSQVGHQPYQKKVSVRDETEITLIVKLVVSVLNEVEISSKKDSKWETQLTRFKKLFFGDSPHSSFCKIRNPWVLEFAEDEKGNFVASATAPLDVENLSLGYRITYQLANFKVGPTGYTIAGNVRFQSLLTTDSATVIVWAKRRNSAYESSYRHLFKSMIDGKVKEEGFELYEDRSGSAEVVRSANFLSNINKSLYLFSTEGKVTLGKLPNQYVIQLPDRLEVHYLNRSVNARVYTNVVNPVSWIEVKGGSIEVNELGVILNPAKMIVLGAMSEGRIAEILPYDYAPAVNNKSIRPSARKKTVSAMAYLMEKPYLQTDRSYYFPQDVIWFEGYMNYYAPAMKDSLSKVLYVDVVNSSKQVLETRLFPIVDGRVTGNIPLQPKWGVGNFILRAYTRWQLNFDESLIFVKPFRVIDYQESVKQINVDEVGKSASRVNIDIGKDQFSPREKITLNIESKDFYGYPKASHLSISVTDIKGAVPLQNEKSILSVFPFSSSSLPDSSAKNPTFLIQYGTELKGSFEFEKKKTAKSLITFYQENSNDMINVITDDVGKFFIPNLQLYDTAKLYVQAKSVKGKKTGTVVLDSVAISPKVSGFEIIKLEMEKRDYNSDPRFKTPDQLQVYLLNDVTVTDTRLDDSKSKGLSSGLHLNSDFSINEEDIRKGAESGDLLMFLQSKIPGFRIATTFGTIPTRYIVLAGSSGLTNMPNPATSEPIVMVDNVVLNPANGTAADQISNLNPSFIQRIEVIKYGGGAAYGARGGNGVIAIYTMNGKSAIQATKFDKTKLQEVRVKGLASPRKFKSPDYSVLREEDKKGDYRTTIYWNPEVSTDGQMPTAVSFFAADLPSQYRIVIEGVDADGKPLHGEKIITVK